MEQLTEINSGSYGKLYKISDDMIVKKTNILNDSGNGISKCNLLEVVKYISKENIKEVKISGDSLLVVNQVNGKWKCKKPELLKYRDLAMMHLKNVTFELTHVPRAQNMEADMLSRKGN